MVRVSYRLSICNVNKCCFVKKLNLDFVFSFAKRNPITVNNYKKRIENEKLQQIEEIKRALNKIAGISSGLCINWLEFLNTSYINTKV